MLVRSSSPSDSGGGSRSRRGRSIRSSRFLLQLLVRSGARYSRARHRAGCRSPASASPPPRPSPTSRRLASGVSARWHSRPSRSRALRSPAASPWRPSLPAWTTAAAIAAIALAPLAPAHPARAVQGALVPARPHRHRSANLAVEAAPDPQLPQVERARAVLRASPPGSLVITGACSAGPRRTSRTTRPPSRSTARVDLFDTPTTGGDPLPARRTPRLLPARRAGPYSSDGFAATP
jgi:hypothetical protein